MHYDAVLFDLDGTLTDSAKGIYHSIRYAIDKLGLENLEEAAMRQFIGPPLYESFQKHFHMSPEEATQAIAVYREDFTTQGLFINSVYTGLPNLLRRLKSQGVYLAVATSKPQVFARTVLDHLGLLDLFDAVVGVSLDAVQESSKAELIRNALPPRYHRAAMVGDRRFDMEGAKANQIHGIGVLYGYGSAQELNDAGADILVEDVPALYRLLCGEAPPPQGLFITVEGVDGSGKTTQIQYLADHLRNAGWEVISTREPGGCPFSEKIRHLLLDAGNLGMSAEAEAYLYAASRAQHVREVIRPALEQGKIVISDRFVDSSAAYQGGGRELGLDKIRQLNDLAVDGCMPDLTLMFLMDVQAALLRRVSATKLDRIERSGEAFFSRVYESLITLARQEPERIRCVDASRTVEAVAEEVCALVDRALWARMKAETP